MTIAIINATEEKYDLSLNLENVSLSGNGILYVITGSNEWAYNEPGKEPNVKIDEKPLRNNSDKLEVTPISVSLYALAVK